MLGPRRDEFALRPPFLFARLSYFRPPANNSLISARYQQSAMANLRLITLFSEILPIKGSIFWVRCRHAKKHPRRAFCGGCEGVAKYVYERICTVRGS